MHPNVITEEPGQCPICGMNLTPIKQSDEVGERSAADAGHEAGTGTRVRAG